MKKGQKSKKGEKGYFQTDHTGLSDGWFGLDLSSKKKHAKLAVKNKRSKK